MNLPLRTAVGAALLALAPACSIDGSDGTIGIFRFSSTPAVEVEQGQPYTYAVLTLSAQGPVAFQLLQGPAGMTISPAGVVNWSPQYADLGAHPVTIRADDGPDEIDQNFTLRVHQGALLGTALSPRGHVSGSTAQDYVDHYTLFAPYGQVIAFHSAWRDSVASAGQIPGVAAAGGAAGDTYPFTPVIGIGWTDGTGAPDLTSDGDPVTNSWFNTESRNEFVAMVVLLVQTYDVPYLFLGNETNAYWLTATQAEWDEWIDVFEEAYLAVKAVRPNTFVYTVYQLERMKGLGAKAGWSDPAHFQLLGDHTPGMIDGIAFTSYPYLEYDDPGSIPAGYWDEISNHWTGPVGFSEIGWLSAPEFPYPGDPADQAAFPGVFFDGVQDLDLEYVAWLFLHDFETPITGFGSIGFRSNDGLTVRPSEAAWQADVALRERAP